MSDDKERVLPEGVIDADPAGGWDGVDDLEARERGEAASSPDGQPPRGPIESDLPTQVADPDLASDEDA